MEGPLESLIAAPLVKSSPQTTERQGCPSAQVTNGHKVFWRGVKCVGRWLEAQQSMLVEWQAVQGRFLARWQASRESSIGQAMQMKGVVGCQHIPPIQLIQWEVFRKLRQNQEWGLSLPRLFFFERIK